jgi:hypothetical protein
MTGAIEQPEFQNRLYEGLLAAYPEYPSLRMMVQLKLHRNLSELVAEGPMNQVVFSLVFSKAVPEGWVVELIDAACKDRPQREDLHKLGLEAGLPDLGGGIRTAIKIVQQNPNQGPLKNYRADFRRAVARMQEVGTFKGVHDWLHEMQNRCYAPILPLLRQFPSDSSCALVRKYRDWLNRSQGMLREMARPAPGAESIFPWIEEQLPEVDRLIEKALSGLSNEDLCAAIAVMEDILSQQLSQVDADLRSSAKALNLEELVSQLREFYAFFEGKTTSEADLKDLSDGIASLDQVRARLLPLIAEHQRWQSVDNSRRAVGRSLRRAQSDLVPSWILLAASLRARCSAAAEQPWAIQLGAAVAALDIAIHGTDFDSMMTLYAEVDGLTGEQFLLADRRLKELTDTFKERASDLNLLLGALSS